MRASGRSFLLIGVTGITRRFSGMAGAIFVRVSAEPAATQARTFEIWIVATDDPAEAEKAVRKGCLPDATLKRFMTGLLRKQSRGWRFRLAKHGFYENKRCLEHPLPAISPK
jgi:hypothetical protein